MPQIKIYNRTNETNPTNFIKKMDASAKNFMLLCLHPAYFKKIFKPTLYIETLEISPNDVNAFKGIKKQKGFLPTREQINILKKDLLSFLPQDQDLHKHWEMIINNFPFTTIMIQDIIFNEDEDTLDTMGDSYKATTNRRESILINDGFVSDNTKIVDNNLVEITVIPSSILKATLSLYKSFPEKNHYTQFFAEAAQSDSDKS